jgi:hypothetical protein
MWHACEKRKEYRVLVRKTKERDHSKNRGVDGRMGSEGDWRVGCRMDPVGSG